MEQSCILETMEDMIWPSYGLLRDQLIKFLKISTREMTRHGHFTSQKNKLNRSSQQPGSNA